MTEGLTFSGNIMNRYNLTIGALVVLSVEETCKMASQIATVTSGALKKAVEVTYSVACMAACTVWIGFSMPGILLGR
jgi:hypothetical protein